MKKLNLFVALAALALSTAALADTANVNVYGTINLSLESVNQTTNPFEAGVSSTDVTNRLRIVSNSSNFGVKGSEDIGSDLKGLYQIEVSANVASGALGAAFRNSMIGLSTPFGSFHLGKWETPFRVLTLYMEPVFGAGVSEMKAILDGVPADAPTLAGTGTNFGRRQANSVWYISPKFYGVTAKLQYTPAGSEKTATITPSMLSASLAYEDNGITAGFGYEKHNQFVAFGDDTGMKATLGYKLMEGTQIGAAWTNLKNKVGSAAEDTYGQVSTSNMLFTATHKVMDPLTLRVGYGIKGKVQTKTSLAGTVTDAETADSDAKMLVIGASYNLSKRTDIYGLFSKISNNKASAVTFAQNAVATVGADQDPQAIAIGVRHTF